MNERLRQLAEELKEARIKKEFSIEQIALRTRIDKKFIQAIEDGNFSLLPDVYIKAFIKEYASEVSLDSDEISKKFDSAKMGKVNIEEVEEKETAKEENLHAKKSFVDAGIQKEKKQTEEINVNYTYYIYGAIAVLIVSILIIYLTNSSTEKQIIVENKYQPKVEKVVVDSPKVAEIKKEVIITPIETPVIVENPFELKISGIDTVWIRAKIDEDKTEEFTLTPLVSRIIKVKTQVDLVVGNSAGAEFFIDNKQVEFQGEKGKVRNLSFTKKGLKK